MKPSVEASTVAIPWYEPEDFSELLRLAQDREEMPADYQTWHRNAVAVPEAWLAKGRVIEIVTVRPREYLAWIKAREIPNTEIPNTMNTNPRRHRAGGVPTRSVIP